MLILSSLASVKFTTRNLRIETDFSVDCGNMLVLVSYFSIPSSREVILKVWKKAGIQGVADGSTLRLPEDPYQAILQNQ